MNVLNESTQGVRLSRRRRTLVGTGLVALTALVVGCVPDPAGETPATSTTTVAPTSSTTTTTAPTTTEATTTTVAPTTTTTAPAVWTPQITVSKSAGLDPDGETVTISGSGFDPGANIGSRPPLSGAKSGVYVTFGKFADVWQPSLGSATAPSSTRQVIAQTWALPEPSFTGQGGVLPYILLNADGTFSTTLDVAPSATGTNAYGFAVYPGSGAVNAGQELLVRATFSPKVTASETADLVAGDTVTVKGIGFLPSANGTRPPLNGQPSGVYATFGRFADVWQPSLGSAAAPSSTRTVITQQWALPPAQYTAQGAALPYILINADGSFTAQIEVAQSAAGTNPNYGFAVYPGSGAVNAAQEFFLPTTWAPVDPPVA